MEVAKIKAVTLYADIELDEEEEEAIKLHPKAAPPKKLEEGFLNLAMDISYTKVRWQIRKEEENGKSKEEAKTK